MRTAEESNAIASSYASDDAMNDAEATMRTTVTLDDDLVAKAAELTGIAERSALMRAGLEALVRVESARRLAALGGTMPTAEAGRRRRSDAR